MATATIIFIKAGEHEVEGYQREPGEDQDEDDEDDEDLHEPYLLIQYALQIIGAGRDKTVIRNGGFEIKGTKEEGKRAVLKDMTLCGASEMGVYGNNGLSWLCDSMTFIQCGGSGVSAWNTKGRLINCAITQCRISGIFCGSNALIELEGDQTKVDGNDTSGFGYGLFTYDTSSIIHLLFPLTKESVSTNNLGGGNYGSYLNRGGTIKTVESFETL